MAYKPNKKKLLGDKTMNDETIRVNHPEDHPDVKNITKGIKKSNKEFKENNPTLHKIGKKLGLMKDPKKQAKRMADTIQTIGSKKMTESEGSFAKGGRAGYKGGKSVKKKGGCAIKGKSPILR